MGYQFEALTGTLGLDLSGWTRGFSKAEGELGKFSETTARTLSKAANTAGVSLGEMADRADQLSKVLGTDLASAATMLEDALQNPTRGLEALRTAGVAMSEELDGEVERLGPGHLVLAVHRRTTLTTQFFQTLNRATAMRRRRPKN